MGTKPLRLYCHVISEGAASLEHESAEVCVYIIITASDNMSTAKDKG